MPPIQGLDPSVHASERLLQADRARVEQVVAITRILLMRLGLDDEGHIAGVLVWLFLTLPLERDLSTVLVPRLDGDGLLGRNLAARRDSVDTDLDAFRRSCVNILQWHIQCVGDGGRLLPRSSRGSTATHTTGHTAHATRHTSHATRHTS